MNKRKIIIVSIFIITTIISSFLIYKFTLNTRIPSEKENPDTGIPHNNSAVNVPDTNIIESNFDCVGNLPGNLQSTALIAKQDDDLFLCSANGAILYTQNREGKLKRLFDTGDYFTYNFTQIQVSDEYIFAYDSNSESIYGLKFDVKEPYIVAENASRYYIVYGNWLYYYKHTDEGAGIFKVAFDGTKETLLYSGGDSLIQTDGEYIYWLENQTVYKLNIKTSELSYLEENIVSYIQVYGDYIYFHYTSYEDDLYSIGKMNKDGSNKQVLLSGKFLEFDINFIVADEWIYFDNGCQRLSVDGKIKEEIFSNSDCFFEESIDAFNVTTDQEYVYYLLFRTQVEASLLRVPIKPPGGDAFENVEILSTAKNTWVKYTVENYNSTINPVEIYY